jgi:F-box domain
MSFKIDSTINQHKYSVNVEKDQTDLMDISQELVENINQRPLNSLPEELVLEIFSQLNLATHGKSRLVSKGWNQFLGESTRWKRTVYKEIAPFGNDEWAKCFGKDVVKNEEDDKEEFLSLSPAIVEDYRRFKSAFPEKSAKDSLMFVRLPKTLNGRLTLKSLGEMAKRYFPDNDTGYNFISPAIFDELGDKSIDKSRWVLMTKDVLPGSRYKSYDKQKYIIANLAQKALIGYEVPETLEAAACILAKYFDSNTRLFSDNPWTYTRCKENVQNLQTFVGGFAPAGLDVYCCNCYDFDIIGVAALRKF